MIIADYFVDTEQKNVDFISQALVQAESYGVRRFIVISGQQSWCYQQALDLSKRYSGDWLWISDNSDVAIHRISGSKAHTLLGQELKHTVFDATESFDADALAAVSGTLIVGSLLVLLVPDWLSWENMPDKDSQRWSEKEKPIETPRFVQHFKRSLLAQSDYILWRQNRSIQGKLLPVRECWQKPDGKPTIQQQDLLKRLLTANPDYYVLTADRGRGKSALAGMLVEHWQGTGECWLTGPNKLSAAGVLQWSNNKAQFIAPDKLIELCQRQKNANVDWLIVDEAAAIPTPLLYQLLPFFGRILFTTTVLGYEGTGRGFLLKFCAGLPHWQKLTLSSPVRWADNDPLENFINDLLLFDAENDGDNAVSHFSKIVHLSQQQLGHNLALLRQFYGLLTSAHYRTTPLDLRRLLDAPDMGFLATVNENNQVIGALWSVNEGGLSQELAHEVWVGRRRPRGNLVAQSLSAHAGLYEAPILRSVRISRIAVQTEYRRQTIAKRLITELAEQAATNRFDYLSVSFGYTEELWHFWQSSGFSLIHIGSQKEASSGCYAAMAIIPFTAQGKQLLEQGRARFTRSQQLALASQPNRYDMFAKVEQTLDDADWRELAGFAFGHRTIESSKISLQRLLLIDNNSTALALYLEQNYPIAKLVQHLNLSGKKELVKLWRHETSQILFSLNPQKALYLQDWVSEVRAN